MSSAWTAQTPSGGFPSDSLRKPVCVPTVVSMKSPIFGPEEVASVEGRSVSITCYYPPTSVNRHTRKYWCRQGARGHCTTLISSGGYVSSDYVGRANLTNVPESGTFVVDISHLTQKDSGRYKCGLGISSRGLNFDVSLAVSQGKGSGSLDFWGEREGGRISREGRESWHGKGCGSIQSLSYAQ